MLVKIKVEALPLHFIVLGGFLVAYTAVDLMLTHFVILNSVLFLLGIILLTTRQRLDIDLSEKMYSEYYWVLGMKFSNDSAAFQEIKSAVCVTGNYSQEYGKYNRRFISGTMYMGYIELTDQEKLYVGQNKNKQAMLKKITRIADQLKVPVDASAIAKD